MQHNPRLEEIINRNQKLDCRLLFYRTTLLTQDHIRDIMQSPPDIQKEEVLEEGKEEYGLILDYDPFNPYHHWLKTQYERHTSGI